MYSCSSSAGDGPTTVGYTTEAHMDQFQGQEWSKHHLQQSVAFVTKKKEKIKRMQSDWNFRYHLRTIYATNHTERQQLHSPPLPPPPIFVARCHGWMLTATTAKLREPQMAVKRHLRVEEAGNATC